MTSMTAFSDPAEAHPSASSTRRRVARYLAGYLAIAAVLPYLALKVAWLSGSTFGWSDPADAEGSGLFTLNIATAGMDLVAVGAALTFTHRWGRRIPAWVVLFPLWVGTGFLLPIVLTQPFNALHSALTGAPATSPASPLEPWVPTVVYTGFTVQGLALSTAFVLYAMSRWPAVFRTTPSDVPAGATHGLQAVVGTAAGCLAVVVGGAHLSWAFGGTAGLPESLQAGRGLSALFVDGVLGLLAVSGGLGLVTLVARWGGRTPYWLPLALTWAGGGTMFSWGLYSVVNTLAGTAVGAGGEAGMAVHNLTSLGELLAGMLVGTVAAFVLAERSAAAPQAGSAARGRDLSAGSATITS